MTDGATGDQSLSKRLYHAKGWRQGTVFTLPGAGVLTNLPSDVADASVTIGSFPCEVGELLVLVSQDCDIVSDAEANVEALVCTKTPSDAARARMRNLLRDSAREYVLDWEHGLAADARRRVILDKKLLESATPEGWVMPPETHRDFVNWLAWRFNRPAVDDEFVRHIQQPLKAEIKKLERTAPQQLAAFDEAVKEMRIRYPRGDETEATLLLVLNDIEPSLEQSDAIDSIVEALQRSVAKGERYTLAYSAAEYSVVGLRDYEATQPLRFDYLTRWGDELLEPSGVLRRTEPLN